MSPARVGTLTARSVDGRTPRSRRGMNPLNSRHGLRIVSIFPLAVYDFFKRTSQISERAFKECKYEKTIGAGVKGEKGEMFASLYSLRYFLERFFPFSPDIRKPNYNKTFSPSHYQNPELSHWRGQATS